MDQKENAHIQRSNFYWLTHSDYVWWTYVWRAVEYFSYIHYKKYLPKERRFHLMKERISPDKQKMNEILMKVCRSSTILWNLLAPTSNLSPFRVFSFVQHCMLKSVCFKTIISALIVSCGSHKVKQLQTRIDEILSRAKQEKPFCSQHCHFLVALLALL